MYLTIYHEPYNSDSMSYQSNFFISIYTLNNMSFSGNNKIYTNSVSLI